MISREKCWHPLPQTVLYMGINNCQMVFQVRVLLFHIELLRCCLSRPADLCPHFAKLIDRSAYGRKNLRISPSWAVYGVEHMVNVLIQILLCRVPSCDENLVEDRINWKFSCQCVKTRLPFRNFQILHHQWRSNYFVIHCMLRRTPASTLEASTLDGPNY